MKKQDFLAMIEADKAAQNTALIEIQRKIAESQIADEIEELKRDESVIKHRLRFIATIDKHADEIALAFSELKLTEDNYIAIRSDAKSLEKFSQLLATYAKGANVVEDKALYRALPFILSRDKATAEQLRKHLAHATTRQAGMILNMLQRLKLATYDKLTKEYTFASDSRVFKKLATIYAIA